MLATGCRRLGPPPPGPVHLAVIREPLPAGPLIAAFNVANPGIVLNVVGAGAAHAPSQTAAHADQRVTGRAAPLPSATGLVASDLGAAGRATLQPLNPLLGLAGFQPSDIDPATWGLFTLGARQWGMPMVRSRLVVLCDATVFARWRIPLARPGWTWTAFLATCAALSAVRPGVPPLARWDAALADALWPALIAGWGGHLVDARGRFLPVPEAVAVEALRAFAAAHAYAGGAAWGEARVPLAQRPAMALRAFVTAADIDAWVTKAGLAPGVARFPLLPVRPLVPAFAWAHGVLRTAPDPGAALRLLVWSAGYDGQRFVRDLGLVPVLRNLPPEPALLAPPGGLDAAAVLPSPGEDIYPPLALRAVPGARAAFAATVGRLRGTQVVAAAAAAAYRAGAAAANQAVRAAGLGTAGAPWPPLPD